MLRPAPKYCALTLSQAAATSALEHVLTTLYERTSDTEMMGVMTNRLQKLSSHQPIDPANNILSALYMRLEALPAPVVMRVTRVLTHPLVFPHFQRFDLN